MKKSIKKTLLISGATFIYLSSIFFFLRSSYNLKQHDTRIAQLGLPLNYQEEGSYDSIFRASLADASDFPQGPGHDATDAKVYYTNYPQPAYVDCCQEPCGHEVLLEARGAYYYPTDHLFRDIYDYAGLFSLEASMQVWKGLYPWASLGFLYTTGESIGEKDHTRLYLIPIGLGLKYIFSLQKDLFRPYLGGGMVVGYANVHDDSPFVDKKLSGWGIGGIFKAGCITELSSCLFLDFFVDYTYFKKNFSNHNRFIIEETGNMSGISIGGGFGYRF